MGMTLCLRRVSRGKLDELLQNPNEIAWFLYGPDFVIPAEPPPRWKQWLGLVPEELEEEEREWDEPGEDDEFDVGRAWHGLHFILTGTAWEGEPPASYLLKGGEAIGEIEVGFGPARGLWPEELEEFLKALEEVDEAEVERRYNGEAMSRLDLYPDIYKKPEAQVGNVMLLNGALNELKQRLRQWVDEGFGVVFYLY